MIGFVTGLIFCFTIGFGGPKPKPISLPTTILGCPNELKSVLQETFTNGVTSAISRRNGLVFNLGIILG